MLLVQSFAVCKDFLEKKVESLQRWRDLSSKNDRGHWIPGVPTQVEGTPLHSSNIVKVKVWVAQFCPTLWDSMDCRPPGSSVHGNLQARIGVGCHALLQEIFPTQYRIQVSCIADRLFTVWVNREMWSAGVPPVGLWVIKENTEGKWS